MRVPEEAFVGGHTPRPADKRCSSARVPGAVPAAPPSGGFGPRSTASPLPLRAASPAGRDKEPNEYGLSWEAWGEGVRVTLSPSLWLKRPEPEPGARDGGALLSPECGGIWGGGGGRAAAMMRVVRDCLKSPRPPPPPADAREKSSVEQDLQEKEDHIRHRTSEVQDLQDEVKRESSNLQKLHAQKQEVQDLLSGLDEQKAALEEQLSDVRQQCAEEAHLISSLKAELTSQESQISTYEEELSKARAELSRLQRETAELEESVEAGKAQLAPLQQHLHQSQQELTSMQVRLTEMKELDASSSQENWLRGSHSLLVNGAAEYCSLSNSSSETANLHEHLDTPTALETEPGPQESPVRSSPEVPSSEVADEKEGATHSVLEKEDFFSIDSSSLSDTAVESNLDFFQSDPFVGRDPFKDDPFGKIDPFGGDPFKGSDPFAADCFFKPSVTDLFAAPELDPFSAASSSSDLMMETLKDNDPFAPGGTVVAAASDPAVDPFTSVFGSDSCEVGFADFSSLAQDNSEEAFISTTSSSGDSVTLTPGAFEEPPPVKDEEVPPALPPKTGTPTRPCPPLPGKRPLSQLDSSDSLKLNDPFQPFAGNDTPTETALDLYRGPQHTSASATVAHTEAAPSRGANVGAYPTEEDLIEWAKRESEREEKERLARLNQQEQEDLELAIALSKSEISEA
uniref:Epidermal growth factor receptor pathway substrate 15 n=1 Tax=Monodelphis domestica TaxID=13616 RepID=F6YJM0_MONDO